MVFVMIFNHLIYVLVRMVVFVRNVYLKQVIKFLCNISQMIISFSVKTSTARALICPCQNGGICSIMGSPMCTCPNEFTGRFCEISLGKNFVIKEYLLIDD